VPVRYYRHAPSFFHGWQGNAAPRWNEHWGDGWGQQRQNWNRWDHKATPARPPLPTYQRRFTGSHYPSGDQQQQLQQQHFRYQPRDPLVRQQWRQMQSGGAGMPAQQDARQPQHNGAPMHIQGPSHSAAMHQDEPW
jgi:hypothetical protein